MHSVRGHLPVQRVQQINISEQLVRHIKHAAPRRIRQCCGQMSTQTFKQRGADMLQTVPSGPW